MKALFALGLVLVTLGTVAAQVTTTTGAAATGDSSSTAPTSASDWEKLYNQAQAAAAAAELQYQTNRALTIGCFVAALVILILTIVVGCYYHRKKMSEKATKDEWAQNQLDKKTTPMGAVNPGAILNVFQQQSTGGAGGAAPTTSAGNPAMIAVQMEQMVAQV